MNPKKVLFSVILLISIGNFVSAQYLIQDTLQYSLAKTTSVQKVYNHAGTTSISGWSQYFDTPVEVSISGFNFYAVSNCSAPVEVIAKIYLADTDSMIIGNALAIDTILLDTNHYGIDFNSWSSGTGGTFGDILPFKRTALFLTPVIVNQPFLIVVENPSDSSTVLFTNNYNYPELDGNYEYLANMLWNGVWYRSNDQALGLLFNADLLYEPFVTYNADVYYDFSPECLSVPNQTINLTIIDSAGNPTLSAYGNRMYSRAQFYGYPEYQFHWYYGPSDNEYAINPSHLFISPASYTMIMEANMKGWLNDTTISDWNYNTLEVCTETNPVNINFSDVNIYPNPSNGIFNVSGVSGSEIQIYTLVGEKIITFNNCNSNEHLDLTGLDSGTYFIKIIKGKTVITKKISIY